MKAALEIIEPSFGSSFLFSRYAAQENRKAHLWHYHPEIELVHVTGGSGKRQIGSHISYYNDGDLILIGSNLPHCGFTNEDTGNTDETVIQMKPDFLGQAFFELPETRNIRQLFEQARAGIAYGPETRKKVGEKLALLNQASDFERLMGLLSVLNDLQQATDFRILNADGFSVETQMQDNGRIHQVFNHVKDNFQNPIALEEMAALVSMTVPSFCRYFKKITNKTFTRFVNEYRVVHASKLLAEKQMGITEICYESGFNNFSYFNKTFRELTGKTASDYRKQFRNLIEN